MSYIAPTWVDGQAPAINATRLNALCGTVANIDAAMPNKQDKLTFDNTPTAGSNNPVKSSGIKSALDGKAATNHTHAMSDVTGLTTAIQYGPAGVVNFQGSEDFPLAGCVANIEPVQAGSGTPSPTNVRAISGWDAVNLWRFEKNWFPQAEVRLAVGDGNKQIYFPQSLPAGTYTLSATVTSTYSGNCIIIYYKKDGSASSSIGFKQGVREGKQITSVAGNEIVRILFYVGDSYSTSTQNSGTWSNIQVETGSTMTAYEPCQTIDVTFPSSVGTVYGGTLDVLSGVLRVTKIKRKLNELAIGYASPYFFSTVNEKAYGIDIISEVYQTVNVAVTDMPQASIKGGTDNRNIYIKDTRYSSVSALLAAVGDTSIVYVLENPVTYQLTPQQVTAVAGANNVWADTGNVTVAYGAFPGALQRELPRAFETYYITTGKVEDAALGNFATAEGYRTTSSGDYSHAEGYSTVATGWGYGAHAEGANTHATGYFSHAEGINTLASGADPAAPEYGVEYGGSHAEGFGTIASGEQSHAEGRNTTVAGNAAHAEGRDSSAGGDYSHAEGRNTDAVGTASHAEGYHCQALKSYSHAEGSYSKANGVASHAEGYETIANGDYQHVFGKDNVADTTSVEIVGWGTSSTRKNIRTLDTSGNMTIAGTLTQSSDSRLKTVDGEIPDVSDIHAVRFRWNDTNGEHDDKDHIGYIAQDVEKVAPFLVGDDSNGYKALDYIAFLCAKMELLERRVKELEKKKE